jgi:serine/threonine protein kinase
MYETPPLPAACCTLIPALTLLPYVLQSMTGGHGTYEYMAPEQFTGEKGIRPQTDMWGFGATLVHMLSGRRPFPSLPSWQVMHKVMSEQQHPELPFKVEAHPAVKDLLQRCFDRDPTLRPSAVEALQVVQEVLGTFLVRSHAAPAVDCAAVLLCCPCCELLAQQASEREMLMLHRAKDVSSIHQHDVRKLPSLALC